jgi:MGT family glycosyltransferase
VKILFATMPFDGHFNPLTGIAAHLAARGHELAWYASPSYAPKLERLGISHRPYRRAREINQDNVGALFPERAKKKGPALIRFDFEHIFISNTRQHFEDIEELRRDFAFDALFCDGAFYACKLVREKLGVPVYSFGVGPLLSTSPDAPPNFVGMKPARTGAGRLFHRALRALMDAVVMRRGTARYNEILGAFGVPPITTPIFDVSYDCAACVFQSGVPGFEYPRRDLGRNIKFVGPLLPAHKATRAPFAHAEKLARFPSVVVISQGTVDNKDPQKLIVPALEALRGGPHLLVVTTGFANTAELKGRYAADNIIVEDYIDFDFILEYADIFICNGGYGSVLLGLSKGVPLVAAGVREGKNDINARIDYFGLGVDLKTESPTPQQIARAVARLVSDKKVAANVARLRDEFARYSPFELIERELAAAQ